MRQDTGDLTVANITATELFFGFITLLTALVTALVIGIQVFQHGDRGQTYDTGHFAPVLSLRLQPTQRIPPQPGQWAQWEAI